MPEGREFACLTVLQVLRRSTEYLGRSRSNSPRLEAELLLAHALGLGRIDLYLQFDRPLDEPEIDLARSLLKRRSRGTPIAYLVGEREFYGLALAVRPGVLIPRPESELLVEIGLRRLEEDQRPSSCADLGTGSGALGVALASLAPSVRVEAVDLAEVAVEVARDNARRLGVSDRFTAVQGSWRDALRGRGPYDLIVSNPPYLTDGELRDSDRGVRDFEPALALAGGPDGLTAYRELITALSALAAPGTTVLLEVDPRRAAAVAAMCLQAWPGCTLRTHRDLSGKDRVVEASLS